jgi:hypothetical protein
MCLILEGKINLRTFLNIQTMRLLVIILIFVTSNSFGQGYIFTKDSQVGSLGLGLSGIYGNSSLSFQYEKGMWPIDNAGVVSLAGYIGFGEGNKIGGVYTIIGVRSAFHCSIPIVKNLDPYGGLMIGFVSRSVGVSLPSIYIGSRYYFTDNFAVFAELGSGTSFLTGGLAIQF